jgi:ferredoxin-like protein FixX
MKDGRMLHWLGKGLGTGIKTSRYPAEGDKTPGVSPGRPATIRMDAVFSQTLVEACPTKALQASDLGVSVDYRTCVHCFRCCRTDPAIVDWQSGYPWGTWSKGTQGSLEKDAKVFQSSAYIRFIDAGACGACISEARLLNNPYYNMHRLGLFMTASPRQAGYPACCRAPHGCNAGDALGGLRGHALAETRGGQRRLRDFRRRLWD